MVDVIETYMCGKCAMEYKEYDEAEICCSQNIQIENKKYAEDEEQND